MAPPAFRIVPMTPDDWPHVRAIYPENASSLALHRACGFRDVGRRGRIGKMHGVWRDVLLLERRSGSAGAD